MPASRVTFDVDGGVGDLELWLIDRNGRVVANNDDFVTGPDPGSTSIFDPQITFTGPETALYHLVVARHAGTYNNRNFVFDTRSVGQDEESSFFLHVSTPTLPNRTLYGPGDDSVVLSQSASRTSGPTGDGDWGW